VSESVDKNVTGAFLLWKAALIAGDDLRIELAQAILAQCGYPGGEGARPVNVVAAEIEARDAS
jgi:hypothetical protein